ncbi:MAG: CoA transferase [Dehalococcoidia bacterium]
MVVVDCSDSVASRFAASVLAGQGARVLRPARESDARDEPGLARILSRGIELCSRPANADEWDSLLSTANAVLVNAPEGDWGKVGGLVSRFPALSVVCSTPYGLASYSSSGKWTPLTLAAESGLLGITGEPDGAPEAIRGHVTSFACGWAISSAAWASYRGAQISGRGGLVDLSLLEMFVFLQWNATQRAAFENVVMQRQGARGLGHPWGVYPCKDGHVILIVGAGGRNWARFAQVMGIPELAESRYESAQARAQHADEIDALMLPWLMEHTAEEIFTSAQEANLPFGMVCSPATLLQDAQLNSRDFFPADETGLRWPQLPFRINGVRPRWGLPAEAHGVAR